MNTPSRPEGESHRASHEAAPASDAPQRPGPDDAAVPPDRYLREALRQAPDARLSAPAELGAAILQRARAAVAQEARSAPAAARPRPTPSFAERARRVLMAVWDGLARPPVAAAMASVLLATTLGLLWRDGLMDEPYADPPLPAPTSPTASTQSTTLRPPATPSTTAEPVAPSAEAVRSGPARAEDRLPSTAATTPPPRAKALASPGPEAREAPAAAPVAQAPDPRPAARAAAPAPAPAPAPTPAPAAAPGLASTPAEAQAPAKASPSSPPLPAAMLPVAPAAAPAPPAQRPSSTDGAADTAVSTAGGPTELGDAAGTRRLAPGSRPGSTTAAVGNMAATPGRSETMRRIPVDGSQGAEALAELADRLRTEPQHWTVQQPGAMPRATAGAAADWLDALGREAAAAGARWQTVPRVPGAAPPEATAPPTLTLLRDGEPRHHFALEEGRWRWTDLSRPGPARALDLPPDALRRLAERLP